MSIPSDAHPIRLWRLPLPVVGCGCERRRAPPIASLADWQLKFTATITYANMRFVRRYGFVRLGYLSLEGGGYAGGGCAKP